jgi:hypothetical protein
MVLVMAAQTDMAKAAEEAHDKAEKEAAAKRDEYSTPQGQERD